MHKTTEKPWKLNPKGNQSHQICNKKHVQKSMSKNAEWKSTGTPVREPTGEAIPASAPGSLGLIYPHVVVTTERVWVLCVLSVCTCLSALTLCTCLSSLSLCTSLFALHSVYSPLIDFLSVLTCCTSLRRMSFEMIGFGETGHRATSGVGPSFFSLFSHRFLEWFLMDFGSIFGSLFG